MLDGVQFPIRNLGGTQNQLGLNAPAAIAGNAGTAAAGTASPAGYGLPTNYNVSTNYTPPSYSPPSYSPPSYSPPVVVNNNYGNVGYTNVNQNYGGNNYGNQNNGYASGGFRPPGFPPPGFPPPGFPPPGFPPPGFPGGPGASQQVAGNSGRANVIVVDQTDVAKAGIDIDGDGRNDVAHGTIVGRDILAKSPNANVSNLELANYEPGTLVNSFNSIAQRVDRGERVDAVNFSAQTFNKIADLANVTGLQLTRENLAQNRDEIKNRLNVLTQNPGAFGGDPAKVKDFTDFVPVIQALDGLTQRGVPVYIAAGNDGPDQVNLFALASGANIIGAADGNGNKAAFSADNSLITRFTTGVFPITPVANGNGQIVGADFTGDGRRDIRATQLSGQGTTFVNGREVSGTSFASPTALGEDLVRNGFGAGIRGLA